jgi:hypothetical protein
MGSGKTSTAKFVEQTLNDRQRPTALYLEGNLDHPADYDAVACLDAQRYQSLADLHPEHRDALRCFTERQGEDFLVSYGKSGQQLPLPLYQELQKHDIYDGIALEKHRELLTARWSQFATQQAHQNSTTILECCFLQNPMCMFLAKHNAGREAVVQHILELAETIRSLDPLLVYIYQTNIRETIDRVRGERSPEWFDFVVAYHTQQGYGQAHGLEGYDGFLAFLQMRQELELEICERLPIRTLVIDNSSYDWSQVLPRVAAAL